MNIIFFVFCYNNNVDFFPLLIKAVTSYKGHSFMQFLRFLFNFNIRRLIQSVFVTTYMEGSLKCMKEDIWWWASFRVQKNWLADGSSLTGRNNFSSFFFVNRWRAKGHHLQAAGQRPHSFDCTLLESGKRGDATAAAAGPRCPHWWWWTAVAAARRNDHPPQGIENKTHAENDDAIELFLRQNAETTKNTQLSILLFKFYQWW